MRFLIKPFKNTKIAYVIRKNPPLKAIVKSIYKLVMFPFSRRGIDVKIGGQGIWKLDYNFAFRGYEDFGDRHNAGFKKWIECCKNKTTVFDIGAHIGLYTIPASKVAKTVYAFEPSIASIRYLKRHLEYNNIHNVAVYPYIVGGEKREKQIFYENKNTDSAGSLYPKKNRNLYSEVYREQVSLDDFTKRFKLNPDVIKIDVEGSECNVLKGAYEIISKCKPVIFLSVHPKRLGPSSLNELKDIITSLRYIVRDRDGRRVSEFDFEEYTLMPA